MNYKILLLSCLALVSSRVMAEKAPFGTSPGLKLGAELENYCYKEPGVMREDGALLGVSLDWTSLWGDDRFSKTQFSYHLGRADYTGSGTLNHTPVRKMEFRFVVGSDISLDRGVLATYTGFGCRSLYNDLRGTSSTGAKGYRRMNTMLYLPLGVDYYVDIGDYRTVWNGEFDLFLAGRQESMLQDLGESQLNNTQHSGFGVRCGVSVEMGRWSFGPYFRYWHIDDSDGVFVEAGIIGYEPDNRTSEMGVEVKYRF